MGIRRRRKKLTNLISNMDRRIRSVEFKKTAYGITTTTEEKSSNEEVGGNEPPGSVYSPTLPNPWTRVKRAYFHPSNVIAGDRFEILFYNTEGIESISGSSVERGDYVSISALGRTAAPIVTVGRTYFKNTNASNPFYTCRAHGTPSWSLSSTNTRESLKFKGSQVYVPLPISGDTFGTVTHTYLFSHGTSLTGASARYSLATRALIASHSATTTTATLTIGASSHHYSENDIIDVNDLPEAYRGVDGLFKVKSVTSTTISYDFDTPLEAAISSATASSGVYVYSVAQKYVRVGSTWFDTADENKVYYWNGLRYQSSKVTGLTNDGSPPSPPTNLTLTTSGYARPDGSSRSRVDVSWSAPTTSENGNTLDDLLGYKIRISETGYSNWRDTRDLNGKDTSETITGLDPDKTYYFRVTAYDSFGNESTGLDGNIVTGLAALTVTTPSAPIIPTPRLGVVAVTWDGKDSSGATVPGELIKYLEVHASTSSGFTPSESTLKGKIYRASDPCHIVGLTYNTTYYFKFIAIDTSDNATSASTQTSTIIKPLVDTDLIAAQVNAPLTAWPFASGTVTAGALASGAISTSNMFAANVVVQSAIAANAIGADQIAAGSIVAGKLAANSIAAGNIQALAINAGHINSNTITADLINVGSVAAAVVTSTYVTGEVISGTKIVQFYSPNSGYDKVVMGYNDPTSGNNGGVGLSLYSLSSRTDDTYYNSGTGETTYYNPSGFAGYLGSWGVGGIELATHYSYSYFDMNRGSLNTGAGFNVNLTTNGSISLSAYDYAGLSGDGYIYTSAKRLTHAGAMTLYTNNSTGFRVEYSDNSARYMNWNARVLSGTTDIGSRLTLVPGNTAWTAIYADGVINYRSLSAISTRDSKFDINTISPESIINSSILDTRLVSYKFKQSDGSEDPSVPQKYGVIAEEMADLGLEKLVTYDNEGKPIGVDYSLFGLFLVPIVKKLRDELDELKKEK